MSLATTLSNQDASLSRLDVQQNNVLAVNTAGDVFARLADASGQNAHALAVYTSSRADNVAGGRTIGYQNSITEDSAARLICELTDRNRQLEAQLKQVRAELQTLQADTAKVQQTNNYQAAQIEMLEKLLRAAEAAPARQHEQMPGTAAPGNAPCDAADSSKKDTGHPSLYPRPQNSSLHSNNPAPSPSQGTTASTPRDPAQSSNENTTLNYPNTSSIGPNMLVIGDNDTCDNGAGLTAGEKVFQALSAGQQWEVLTAQIDDAQLLKAINNIFYAKKENEDYLRKYKGIHTPLSVPQRGTAEFELDKEVFQDSINQIFKYDRTKHYFPIIAGGHWTTLVIETCDNKIAQLMLFDSQGTNASARESLKQLISLLPRNLFLEKPDRTGRRAGGLKLQNGPIEISQSCGMFTLAAIMSLVKEEEVQATSIEGRKPQTPDEVLRNFAREFRGLSDDKKREWNKALRLETLY